MDDEEKFKIALISGAAHALNYKNRNPRASEEEIIQHVTNNADEILKKMDDEL